MLAGRYRPVLHWPCVCGGRLNLARTGLSSRVGQASLSGSASSSGRNTVPATQTRHGWIHHGRLVSRSKVKYDHNVTRVAAFGGSNVTLLRCGAAGGREPAPPYMAASPIGASAGSPPARAGRLGDWATGRLGDWGSSLFEPVSHAGSNTNAARSVERSVWARRVCAPYDNVPRVGWVAKGRAPFVFSRHQDRHRDRHRHRHRSGQAADPSHRGLLGRSGPARVQRRVEYLRGK